MEERVTNIVMGILLIAVVVNGVASAGLYNQVQEVQMTSQIDVLENQIDDLILQLSELQSGLAFLNESMVEEIQTIMTDLTELQQTLADLNLADVETQLAEIQARIDQIIASTGVRDFSMIDYNLTGTFTNWMMKSYFVVNSTEFNQDGVYLGASEGFFDPVVKGLWWWYYAGIKTPDNDPSIYEGNYTLVMLIWSPYRNVSSSWSSIEALIITNDWYEPDGWHNTNDTMSAQGVGDVIEITYSPYYLNVSYRDGAFVMFRMNNDFPEGEYRIMMALKEVG